MNSVFDGIESIVCGGQNACYQYFLLKNNGFRNLLEGGVGNKNRVVW